MQPPITTYSTTYLQALRDLHLKALPYLRLPIDTLRIPACHIPQFPIMEFHASKKYKVVLSERLRRNAEDSYVNASVQGIRGRPTPGELI